MRKLKSLTARYPIFASIVLIIAMSILLFWIWLNYFERDYYYSKDGKKCVTVWDKPGEYVYIIPGKYKGLTLPKENYVQSDRRNVFLIVWNKPEEYFFTITWRNNYPIDIKLDRNKYKFLNRASEKDLIEYEKLYTTDQYKMKVDIDYFELDWNK